MPDNHRFFRIGYEKMKEKLSIIAAALLLTACGSENSSSSSEESIQYVKTSVMYDMISDMYQNPDSYIGKTYHFVGTLYPGTDDETGEKFYSVSATEPGGDCEIGIELDWNDYSGLEDYDLITVEGKLERTKMQHDGGEIEVLILRVSSLEKRES